MDIKILFIDHRLGILEDLLNGIISNYTSTIITCEENFISNVKKILLVTEISYIPLNFYVSYLSKASLDSNF